MRTITVQFYANNGTATLGASADVSTSLVELADISWNFDERFCKAEPGQISLKLGDEDGSIWTWLQGQLATTRDTYAQLLNPWVVVTVGGARAFLGLVDLATIKRDYATRMVDLAADDWSVLLRDLPLEGITWQRALPKGSVTRPQAGPWTGTRTVDYPADMVRFYPAQDIQVGETLRVASTDYRVATVVRQGVIDGDGRNSGTEQYVILVGWNQTGAGSWSFTRIAGTVGELGGYTVATDTTPTDLYGGLRVKLGTSDQLAPGDVLKTPGDAELVIVDVDPTTGSVVLSAPVTETLAAGTLLTLTEETAAQLIYQDAREIIKAAAAPYRVDLTRFQAATLPRPVHAWLPLRWQGVDLRQVSDIEPTLSAVRVLGHLTTSTAYTGTPEAGWSVGTTGTRYCDWTAQRTTAPAYLMPDDRIGVAGLTRMRNRVYPSRSYGKPLWVVSDVEQDPPTWSAPVIIWPATVYAYDYAQFRRLVVTNPTGGPNTGGNSTLEEKRWNGSAWSAPTSQNWPVTGWHPVSLVPMPGTTATTGPVAPQGQALLAFCVDDAGTAWELQLVHAGAAVRLAVSADYKGAELATTPWGAWLVGFGGAGQVRYTGAALVLDWCKVQDANAQLYPTTLAAISSSSVYVAGTWYTTDKDGNLSLTTAVAELSATAGAPALLNSLQVGNFKPATAIMLRDPSDSTRLLGLLGGRLCQIQAKLPLTIERVKGQGLTSAELLEFVAILHNAILAPRPDGVLEVISRNSTGSTTALTVDQAQVTQQRVSQNFFSVARVSTAKGDFYADAWGVTRGGRVLEISSHPLVWTESVCFGVAATYAAFCGSPRRMETQTWVHENPDTAPTWEALSRWATVTVNGGGTSWLVTGLSHSVTRGECRATLLEVL